MDTRVMIVDDNKMIRESVRILLQSEGIDIVVTDGGPACLICLEQGFRGIILMDIMMPDMDGWDTIREIVDRGLYEGNVILMLTGKSEPDCKMEGIQEYVTDYLTKPFHAGTLIGTIRHLAELRNA
jgi:DNA-binding response OmpR family regulator